MTAELYRGSFVEPILDGLTGAMGIECRLGSAEDSRTGAPPRITFVPPEHGSLRTEPAQFQAAHRTLIELQVATFQVQIWASSRAELWALHQALAIQLDIQQGPRNGLVGIPGQEARPGYDMGEPSSADDDADIASGSCAVVVPVSLKNFTSRKDFVQVPIQQVPVAVATSVQPWEGPPQPAVP